MRRALTRRLENNLLRTLWLGFFQVFLVMQGIAEEEVTRIAVDASVPASSLARQNPIKRRHSNIPHPHQSGCRH